MECEEKLCDCFSLQDDWCMYVLYGINSNVNSISDVNGISSNVNSNSSNVNSNSSDLNGNCSISMIFLVL